MLKYAASHMDSEFCPAVMWCCSLHTRHHYWRCSEGCEEHAIHVFHGACLHELLKYYSFEV